jgi:hypothetical protein
MAFTVEILAWRFAPLRCRLYRGQCVDMPLLPRFAREAQTRGINDPLRSERELLETFQALSIPYLGQGRPRISISHNGHG